MKFGPQRGHISCVFDNFFKDFGLVLVAIVVSLISGDMDLLSENAGILVIVLLGPVMRILGYLTTTYAIDEEKLIIKSGVFTKNQLEVPLSTITTVDFSQNIFHQIFGVFKLNIDNNANVAEGDTKVHMTLKKTDADAAKKLLMQGRQGMDGSNFAGEKNVENLPRREEGRRYDVKSSDLILMGLLKSKGIFFLELIGAIAVIANFIPVEWEDETLIAGIADVVNRLGATPAVLLLVLLFFLLASVCGMVGSLIKYYGFEVLDNGEAVKIEYGLLNRKTYTITKKKISGIYFEQSALMRLTKIGVLNLMAVGYGAGTDEESNEEAILFPLMNEAKLHETISSILPELQDRDLYQKPEPKALRYFFIRFSVLFALAVLVGTCFLPKIDDFFRGTWILGVVYLLWTLFGAFLDYRTTGIYGNEKHFSLCSGGYKKWTFFIKTAMIESIESSGSIWKRKRGVGSISIGCLAPMGQSTQTVCNLPAKTFEEVKTYLIY